MKNFGNSNVKVYSRTLFKVKAITLPYWQNGFQLGFGKIHVLWMLNISNKGTILSGFEKN